MLLYTTANVGKETAPAGKALPERRQVKPKPNVHSVNMGTRLVFQSSLLSYAIRTVNDLVHTQFSIHNAM